MKKVIKSPLEPQELQDFVAQCSNADFEQLKSDNHGITYKKIKERIIADQGGLCAYCEAKMDRIPNDCRENFRVEHFCPKHVSGPPNWALKWGNLLGCCHGGSVGHDAGRELSCDAKKGGNDFRNRILDPLAITALDRIFLYDTVTEEKGKMEIDFETCPTAAKILAENTITLLGLNVRRLMRLRAEVVDAIYGQIQIGLDNNLSHEDAIKEVVRAQFGQPQSGWPAFFTLIRIILLPASDDFLRSIQYDG